MSGVVLGGVALSGFEVPEQVSFGGAQQLAVHRLPGGARIVDAMGADDHNIGWSGMMIGPDAADRARVLDGLRTAGRAVPLVFGDMFFNVIVASFEAGYRRRSWIGSYRISCLVIPDIAVGTLSLTAMLAGGLAQIAGIDPAGAVPGLAATVAGAQSILLTAGSLIGGTAAAINVAEALRTVASVVTVGRAYAEGQLATLAAVGMADNGAVGGPGGLQMISAQAEQLAKCGIAAETIDCAIGNLAMGAA